MIGKLVDRAIAVFSPEKAIRRSHARRVYESMASRAYDAGKTDRLNSSWRTPNQSADLELLNDADTTRGRARDLVRNNAYAKGIVRAVVRNVVGRGIRPQCRVLKANGDENERFCFAAEELWEKWQRRCDVTGRFSFYEIQRLAMSERYEAGELLIHFTTSTDRSRALPLALELIEADRFVDDGHFARGVNPETGNEVRRGVEINASGVPVAYHLWERHQNDLNYTRAMAVRHPAQNFLHLFKPTRIGQTRGMSEFAPVVFWLRNLHKSVDNEMIAQAVASCFSVAIKSSGAGADGSLSGLPGEGASDANGNSFEHIEPGMVARLFPDEDISVINPGRASAEAQTWVTLMQRAMGVGTGLSYERLSRDYSQTNYSSNRAADLEDRREFRIEQQWLTDALNIPVWHRFLEAAALRRVKGFPNESDLLINWDRWSAHVWQPEGWEWVDPLKEEQASQEAVAGRQSTLAEECGKRGRDWREVIDQWQREQRYIKQREQELEDEFGPDEPEPGSEAVAEDQDTASDEDTDIEEVNEEEAATVGA